MVFATATCLNTALGVFGVTVTATFQGETGATRPRQKSVRSQEDSTYALRGREAHRQSLD